MDTIRIELRAADETVLGHADVSPTDQIPEAVVSAAAGVSMDCLAGVVIDRLPGHRIGVHTAQLESALATAGGIREIHRLLMVLDLSRAQPRSSAPEGFVVTSLISDASRYAPLYVRAYPPEHPDHDPSRSSIEDIEDTIGRYLRGQAVGPLDAWASCEVRDRTDAAVGLAIVNQISLPRYQGPWLTELIVDPAHQGRGLGACLVRRVALRLSEQGRSSLGLAVTDGIPARHVYEKLGFSTIHETWWLHTPPRAVQ